MYLTLYPQPSQYVNFLFYGTIFFFSFQKWWSAVCTRLFVNLTWRHRSTTPVTTDVPPTSSTPSTTSKPRGKYYWGGGVLLGSEGRSGFSQFRVLHTFGISYTYTPKTSIITDRCQGPLRWNASSKSHESFKIFISEIFVYFLRLNAVEVDVIELKQSVDANFKILHRYVALPNR